MHGAKVKIYISLIHIKRITCIDTLQRIEMPGRIEMLEKKNGFQKSLLILLEDPPPNSLAHL